MPGIPADQDQGPDREAARSQDNSQSLAAKGKRSGLGAFLMPFGLVVLGLALLVAAFVLYPQTTELPTPPYSNLQVATTFHIFIISYAVYPTSPTMAAVTISVSLPAGTKQPPARALPARLTVAPPPGVTFWHCHAQTCTRPQGKPIRGTWSEALAFNSTGQATDRFFVKASNFGVTSNGVTAAAAIPGVYYLGPGRPILLTGYRLQSAASYDWSSFETQYATRHAAVWYEPLTNGYTPGRAAVGIDHAAQSHDDFIIFLAGALIALGGGAILAGILEALHVSDWDVIRALRSKEQAAVAQTTAPNSVSTGDARDPDPR
jgi:hypothetical protein